MDIIEGNRLIAVFMGAKLAEGRKGNVYQYPINETPLPPHTYMNVSVMKYHTSWDWLMPVIIKISQYQFDDPEEERQDYSYPRTFGMISDEGLFMFRYNRGFLHQNESLITAAYDATVDFIQWYNTQTK